MGKELSMLLNGTERKVDFSQNPSSGAVLIAPARFKGHASKVDIYTLDTILQEAGIVYSGVKASTNFGSKYGFNDYRFLDMTVDAAGCLKEAHIWLYLHSAPIEGAVKLELMNPLIERRREHNIINYGYVILEKVISHVEDSDNFL